MDLLPINDIILGFDDVNFSVENLQSTTVTHLCLENTFREAIVIYQCDYRNKKDLYVEVIKDSLLVSFDGTNLDIEGITYREFPTVDRLEFSFGTLLNKELVIGLAILCLSIYHHFMTNDLKNFPYNV